MLPVPSKATFRDLFDQLPSLSPSIYLSSRYTLLTVIDSDFLLSNLVEHLQYNTVYIIVLYPIYYM